MARQRIETLRWGDEICLFTERGQCAAPAEQWQHLLTLFVPRVRNLIRQHLAEAQSEARPFIVDEADGGG